VRRDFAEELLQVLVVTDNSFPPHWGQEREFYDAVFLTCSCCLLAFGYRDCPC
jgi:hypothetical protein